MEFRYLGFDQLDNARSYRFDVAEDGQPIKHCTVTVDLSLFHTHGVGIQDGPSLSASKLTADLERQFTGDHRLTAEDLQTHADACALAAAERAATRKSPRRRPAPAQASSPWRNSGS